MIADNATGYFMAQGEIDLVIVGADRIAANGDVANKIGTYTVAVLAKEHAIPFYVAAPVSTFDLATPTGAGIPIEDIAKERSLAISTIESHIARAIEGGENLEPRTFYTRAEEEEMQAAFVGHEGLALAPIHEKLDGKISYGKLKMFLAFRLRSELC